MPLLKLVPKLKSRSTTSSRNHSIEEVAAAVAVESQTVAEPVVLSQEVSPLTEETVLVEETNRY